MLGKLIKYELRKSVKGILIMWAVVVALALTSGISSRAGHLASVLVYLLSTTFFFVVSVLVILAVAANAVIMFYREMLTAEGYLTHMLPVKPWQHIVSGAAVTFVWLFLSIVIMFASLGLMDLLSGNTGTSFLSSLAEGTGLAEAGIGAGDIILYAAYILTAALAGLLAIYTAILLGGCANKRKGLFVFLALVGIFAADGILCFLLGFGDTVHIVDTEGIFSAYITVASWKETVYQVILIFIFFFSSRDLLSKRINLT